MTRPDRTEIRLGLSHWQDLHDYNTHYYSSYWENNVCQTLKGSKFLWLSRESLWVSQKLLISKDELGLWKKPQTKLKINPKSTIIVTSWHVLLTLLTFKNFSFQNYYVIIYRKEPCLNLTELRKKEHAFEPLKWCI